VNFDAVFNRQKTRTVTRSLGTDFTVQSRNDAYNNSTKIIQKFTVRPKEGGLSHRRLPPPEYAADSIHTQLITRRRLLPAAGDVLQRCTLWFCGSVRLQVKTRCSSSGGGSASQTAGAATPSAKVRSCRTDKHVLPPEICPTRNVGDREADVFELGWTMDI